jgi:ABC-type lipoprotein release transport system permease subunit
MIYFRQLSYILGSMSLIVTVLLVATLLTITVNQRLPEIATLRAIGLSRQTIVTQVLVEGTLLTLIGSSAGILLGLATAHYLDSILTTFPGLPAAFSFFVDSTPRGWSLDCLSLRPCARRQHEAGSRCPEFVQGLSHERRNRPRTSGGVS